MIVMQRDPIQDLPTSARMAESASVSAVAASRAMAMSNGSGLRSTRLRMSAPSTLLHTLVANPVAREAGTFFSVRRAASVVIYTIPFDQWRRTAAFPTGRASGPPVCRHPGRSR
jgi:hypothetical protein